MAYDPAYRSKQALEDFAARRVVAEHNSLMEAQALRLTLRSRRVTPRVCPVLTPCRGRRCQSRIAESKSLTGRSFCRRRNGSDAAEGTAR